MAWRIHQQVVRGELDNRVKGKVTGSIWLIGRAEPIRLELTGHPWRDWAGCILRFTHATPQPGDLEGLASEQVGVCGDLTASRRVRIPPEPVSEWLRQGAPGKESLPWGNAVYLEWFSEYNGRVVIESSHFAVEITEPAWNLSAEEEEAQRAENLDHMERYFAQLEAALEPRGDGQTIPNEPANAAVDPDEVQAGQTLELISGIEELKRKAQDLVGGEMIESSPGSNLPLEIQHQFWENIVAFESAPRRIPREVLAEDGCHLLSPETLGDAELTVDLWRAIQTLAGHNIFLTTTDHLSDRELYTLLFERVLEEEIEILPAQAGWNCRIAMHEYGTADDEDGSDLYLRYYADEEFRAQWVADFGEPIPPHLDPPYDRDRFLPQ